jgi:transposase
METIKIIKWSLGIDVGAKSIRCCLSSINSILFNNTAGGLQELLLWIRKHYQDGEVPLSVAMEATGVYYERLYYYKRKAFVSALFYPPKQSDICNALNLLES